MHTRLTPKEQAEQFLNDTDDNRERALRRRDYYDGHQWTAHQIAVLNADGRKQAPIVVNKIKPKVEGLLGLYELRKNDPKAFPVTPKHEDAASPITDALRFVTRKEDFDLKRLDVAEDFFIEGVGGIFVDIRQVKGELQVVLNRIHWDRLYYDTHSRDKLFKDARFMGLWVWLDEDQIEDMFPNVNVQDLDASPHDHILEDRPRWRNAEGKRKRYRIAQHFHVEKDRWKMTIFSGDLTIRPTVDSPYLDEDGIPDNPIRLVSAFVGIDNERYGEVEAFMDLQDEFNHRRSKFLHLHSTRQTFGNQTAIADEVEAKKELQKPNGHLKIMGEAKFGEDFGIIPTGDMAQAQFLLMQDTDAQLSATSFSGPLAGDLQKGELSGKAIKEVKASSTVELNRQYALLRNWELEVYRAIWARIKQFWTEERWLNVTDDQEDLRWVGFNSKIPFSQLLTEQAEDESLDPEIRKQALTTQQFFIQYQQQFGQPHPRFNEFVEVRNEVARMDMDIIIEESVDFVNTNAETFQFILQYLNSPDVDIIDAIELSPMRGKDKKAFIAKIEARRASASQQQVRAQQGEQQLDQAERITKIQKDSAQTRNLDANTEKTGMETITQQIENVILVNNPDPKPQVIT